MFEPDETEQVENFNIRMIEKLSQLVADNREVILKDPEPMLKFIELYVKHYVTKAEFKGEQNFPDQGRVVVASNHQFGYVDILSLMNFLTQKYKGRPWTFVSNVGTFTRLFPHWREDPRFSDHIIPVSREKIGFNARIVNGEQIIQKAISFLESNNNPMLFIAPEGADATYQNQIYRPRRGFARIAREAEASIVQAVITGVVDREKLLFSFAERLCPHYKPDADDQVTADKWLSYYQNPQT